MAQYKFEGDTQNIDERQLEFINRVIEQQGFTNRKVTFEAVGAAGDNYVANVKRIVVQGDGGNLSIIAKIAPTSDQARESLPTGISFANEIFVYEKILPKLLQLQKQAGVPDDELIKFPKYYGALSEAPYETVLLEDIKVSGFKMLNRFIPLTNDVVRSVLKSLAIWHSLSYVLKAKEPETYKYFIDNIIDLWVHFNDTKQSTMIDFLAQIEAVALGVLADHPQYQSVIKDKVTGSMEQAVKMKKIEDGSRFAVIQHGDAWTNNIMFKFDGDTLKYPMLIDYQVAKNSSPVCDLLYFIFCCTHHEARLEYFYDWLDYYYSELDNSLSDFGMKANYVYPRDQLDADMKRYGKFAVGNTITTMMMTALTPEVASKVQEQMKSSGLSNLLAMEDIDTSTLTEVKKKIIGLVESFHKFGLLS